MAQTDTKVTKERVKTFSTKEICRIIAVCEKHRVSEMTLGDFSVSFRDPTGLKRKLSLQNQQSVSPSDYTPVSDQTEKVSIMPSQQEFEMAQMLIDDPVAFEEAEINACVNVHGVSMVQVNEEGYR